MTASKNVHNTHMGAQLRLLHGALLEIVGQMSRPQRDEMLLRAAGVRLDRALFPLLVLVERVGPIGVVDLADRVGRDHTTVSRQVAKLEALGLVTRAGSATDRRVRMVAIAPPGKAMTDSIDAARERLLDAGFASWERQDVDELVRLTGKLADAMRDAAVTPP